MDGRAVSIVDLSEKGARLELSGAINPGAAIDVQIDTAYGTIDIEATLLWCQIDDLRLDGGQDRYLAGLVFRESQPAIEWLIADLVSMGAAVPIEDLRSEDRYAILAPLTGGFGDLAPVSIVELSLHGARVHLRSKLVTGAGGPLHFQVDEQNGPTDAFARVTWCAPSRDQGGFVAGLKIEGAESHLRSAIHRLCLRGEARIDALSLRRKFDAMRQRPAVAQAQTA
jgi:hypothetical protein